MALSWIAINNNTLINKQIIEEIFTNLQKVENSLGYQLSGSTTGGSHTLISSKDLVDIYRRLNEAYFIKNGKFPAINNYPKGQGQLSKASIDEIRSLLNSFGV